MKKKTNLKGDIFPFFSKYLERGEKKINISSYHSDNFKQFNKRDRRENALL